MKKSKKIIVMTVVAIVAFLTATIRVQAVEKERNILENFPTETPQKIAYLTFDDGPSIYTEKLLDTLNEHDAYGIFFVTGCQIDFMPDADRILKRIVDEDHFIALHTMTHDKNALYRLEKSPERFTEEMFELRTDLKNRLGWETNLCRAPYGKANHFKAAHYLAVEKAGLYCVDWHVDSQDWAKQNADQVYNQVASQLKDYPDQQELVLLFHEYQRTVDALPRIIKLLREHGYSFVPYVEGHVFEGLD